MLQLLILPLFSIWDSHLSPSRSWERIITIVTIPFLTLTLEQNHLQKVTTIRASLLGPMHYIFYHLNTPPKHPNIAKQQGVERTTLLAPKTKGDTLAWVVDTYDILGIHRLQASQEASLHLEANQHMP